jgi:hypothetical protein
MNENRPTGALSLRTVPAPPVRPTVRSLADAYAYGVRRTRTFGARARWQDANRTHFERSLRAQAAADRAVEGGATTLMGHLWLAKVDAKGRQLDLGLAGCRVVTTAGVNFIVDAFQNLTELENMKFHGVGTGSTAEASSQTALVTELTTQYATASTRPTGTTGEQSGNSNVFESTCTVTVSASVALTEHSIFSQAATGGGVMLDRTVFSAVNLSSGESLQVTYDLQFTAGG